ncbi:LAQU0S03e09032g1_1 [Lachancea quebecensis]|uniref:LAQU0S03e09032g1_1 n=1 Tax=Lachancea quebecensis TaxID=1654605 RepID=A0A0N7MLA2_9SACH|nr:LAQU0S03e09032g1_1 [Lachancea quebecensis]
MSRKFYFQQWKGVLTGVSPLTMASPRFSMFSVLRRISNRLVHSTPKKDHTTLLSNAKLATFNVMSLKALKNECRTRGLKISGRKGELVDRILAFETSGLLADEPIKNTARQIHITKCARSRSNPKPVDDVRMPDIAATEKSLETPEQEYIVHITPLSKSADKKPVTKLEKELSVEEGSANVPPAVSTTDHDKVIFQVDAPTDNVEVVDEEAELAADNQTSKDSNLCSSREELNNRDKMFILGFAAMLAGWWSLKFWGDKDKHRSLS